MFKPGQAVIFKYENNSNWEVGAIDSIHDDVYYVKTMEMGDILTFLHKDSRIQRYWTREEVEKRFPKLIRALQFASVLSVNEAVGGICGYLNREFYGEAFGGEAIQHGGGPLKCIQRAIRCRHIVRLRHAVSGEKV